MDRLASTTTSASSLRLALCLVLFALGCWSGKSRLEKRWSTTQAREDFAVLRHTLEQAHAGLYRHTPKEELDQELDRLAAALDRDRTELELYRLFAPVITKIRCFHTQLSLSRELKFEIQKKGSFLPFEVRFFAGRMFVYDNYSHVPTLEPGSEVLAIDGTSTSELIERLFTVVGSDGWIETTKFGALDQAFAMYYAYLVGMPDSFEITLLLQNGKQATVEVSGLSWAERRRIQKRRPAAGGAEEKPLTCRRLEKLDTAIIRIRTFGVQAMVEAGQEVDLFLRRTFRQLRTDGTKRLIIDVRKNHGGDDDYGSLLLSYLIDRPVRYYERFTFAARDHEAVRYTDLHENPWFISYRGQLDARSRQDVGAVLERYVADHKSLGWIQPQEDAFDGEIYLVGDGLSVSTAAEFLALAHHSKVGFLVGEEIGGTYQGVNGGLLPRLILPNTRMSLRIPLFAYFNAVDPRQWIGRGALPDRVVTASIDDFLQGRDVVMEHILSAVEKQRP